MLVKGLRQGQDDGRYLVLGVDLLGQLDGVTCSPFGAVPKGNVDLTVIARIIHDLSYPVTESVNDHSAKVSNVLVSYDGTLALVSRIIEVEAEDHGKANMMTGDVARAFRNVPLAASAVGRFAGSVPELEIMVIDLVCPFGWTNSPAYYWVAGAAIKHIYASTLPDKQQTSSRPPIPFDSKAWWDDQILIEPDVGTRLVDANISIRAAMVGVLGPNACNEEKFSRWFRVGRALGLLWNLDKMTLSIPPEKIEKARQRIRSMLVSPTTTRRRLNELLRSLRHVATCIPAAKAFFQRITTLAKRTPRFASVRVSTEAKEDFKWFCAVLYQSKLNAVPLSRFAQTEVPNWHVFMNASDFGLCCLLPARNEFIQVEFSALEKARIAKSKTDDSVEFEISLMRVDERCFRRRAVALTYRASRGSVWTMWMLMPLSSVRTVCTYRSLE
ncbi:hypothetical protein JG687_00011068 [Phytophthora cactorum]|uniref:Uncharacterized protein n=1 Tax=Phytophthora cactorum TaxID=29920 RepID=A0A8T1U596_9STRA|nr:hypothetical protein JG687_00011068 [Phytophthora cactorum]